jgi:hypothetical protein
VQDDQDGKRIPAYEGRPLARPGEELVDQGLSFDLGTVMGRRQVLRAFGLGAATLGLAACGDESGSSAPSTSASSAASATASGEIPDETAGPYPGDTTTPTGGQLSGDGAPEGPGGPGGPGGTRPSGPPPNGAPS